MIYTCMGFGESVLNGWILFDSIDILCECVLRNNVFTIHIKPK